MSARFDAVVVGGGPAGATVGMLLARAGRRVLLAERSPIGRDKTCGHCLNGRILPLARRLGIAEAIEAATVGHSGTISVRTCGGRTIDAPLVPGGSIVDRRVLDAALHGGAVAAGCDVVRAAARLRPAPAPPWTIDLVSTDVGDRDHPTAVECDLVIGADGVGSGVARSLGWADSSPGRAFGFSGDLDGLALPTLAPGTIAMHVDDDGYLGAVRRDDGLIHVGALVRPDAPFRSPDAFVHAIARSMPELGELANVAPRSPWRAIGPLPWRPRRIAGHGAALVGDAAGYGEPFTGEGMAWSIESAASLGAVVLGQRRFDEASAAEYRRRWRDVVGRSQRRCALVARVGTRPRILRFAGRLGPALPRVIAARVVAA